MNDRTPPAGGCDPGLAPGPARFLAADDRPDEAQRTATHRCAGVRRHRQETTLSVQASTEAQHRGAAELPFVEIGGGNKLKVIQVDVAEGLWIVENIFQTGYAVQTHRHTGPVYAYTVRGAWKYREYDYVNRAGSFLFEPAGSVHTLECVEDDTQVWFQMYGVNLNLDAEGTIESVFDGPGALEAYYALCEAEGFDRPSVLVS
jgi:quercetin dioxygenase-like cupin family protein